jgi:hypothetical protein
MPEVVKYLFYALVILTPPIVCYYIAQKEGRSSARWFLYGLFFGIFGLIYLIFYAKAGDQDKMPLRMLLFLSLFLISSVLFVIHVYSTIYLNSY